MTQSSHVPPPHAVLRHADSRHALLPHVFLRHSPLPQVQGLCYGRLDLALPPRSFNDTAARLLRDRVDSAKYPLAPDKHDLHRPDVIEHDVVEHDVHEHDVLDPATVAVAPALRDALQRLPILSSPAQRCLGLANALHRLRMPARKNGATDDAEKNNPAMKIPAMNCPMPAIDARLLEMNFGDWEGCAWSDVPREQLDLWALDVVGYRPPGGESFADVIARVGDALAGLREPHLIVTHGGVIRAAWHLLGGKPLADAAALHIAYATPTHIPPV
jgi:broad specificity phosphatase PhoE